MMRSYIISLILLFSAVSNAQIVSLQPANAGADDMVTLIFDASQGNAELKTASKIYVHHGVVTDSETGTDWEYVKGNWGQDDGIGELTRVEGSSVLWQIQFQPTLRSYFGVPANENIFRISAVFRSADGNTKGTITPGNYGWGDVTSNGDFYINLNVSNYVTITTPFKTESYLNPGETFQIEAVASSNITSMKLWIDEGTGYVQKAMVTSGKNISYAYQPTKSVDLGIKAEATINGETVSEEKIHHIVLLKETQTAALPAGVQPGINYNQNDQTKVTLVLEAPGKDFVYVVGDFSNWKSNDELQMNRTPDGEFFWIELDQLTPNHEYVFQYWIDGKIKVGDPYAEKIADPWNDKWIESTVYPNLPAYSFTDYETASVLQTGQQAYEWSSTETTWQRPELDHLMIYELHVRDFVSTHTYSDLIDTLAYLQRLGVDAIELMPVSEFEGNDSWGYNPSYYFAPDKYYGTKNDLKQFIEKAHEKGMAVIMDMVLNHAYGQNPMVKMYFENGKPAPDNPWFNTEYVGPYQWGYDFNHESEYTHRFIDRVNQYWLEEYHFDGYRFDFTKGFTNAAPGGSLDGFDQSRINILKRMADHIWSVDPKAYVILEHWGPTAEENVLGEYGMKKWRNRSYDFVPAVTGQASGSFSGMNAPNHVSYFNSHDERRIAEHALTEGMSNGIYDVKNPLIMFERVKMAAAFAFLQPGPKMMWQFDELGYDIDINLNGRVGRKPLPWGDNGLGYYEDQNRQYIYDAYKAILEVRKQIDPEMLDNATINHKNTGNSRRLSYNTTATDLVVIGNFGLNTESIDPAFTQSGIWYNYFTGEEINVTNVNSLIELKAGEWHIYTTEKLSNGLPGVVEVFESPVTISPSVFNMNNEITITFDATKAWNDGTAGLVDASNVQMVAGIVADISHPQTLSNEKTGVLQKTGDQTWEIKIVPKDFFGTPAAFRLGMYFTDESKQNLGKGFRNSTIFVEVMSEEALVSIEPAAFNADEEITITFNAKQGDRKLMGTSKVYLHSGVSTVATNNPQTSAWNHVVGDWGQDNGKGSMTEVEDDVWQITITPKTYYGLGETDFPYWIACVFRSADGNTKGSGTPGEMGNGIIAAGGDIFIQNQLTNSIENFNKNYVVVYPNPTTGILNFSRVEGVLKVSVYNSYGQLMFAQQLANDKTIQVDHLGKGIYLYQIETGGKMINGRFIKL